MARAAGPYFKPDWSPEHFLTNMYTCHLMVVRRALLERIGGFRAGFDGAQDYDLVLRLIEHTARIHHLPKVLYHWRRIPESTAGERAPSRGRTTRASWRSRTTCAGTN